MINPMRPSHTYIAIVGSLVGTVLAALGLRAAAAIAIVAGLGVGVVAVDAVDRRIPTVLIRIGAMGAALAVIADGIRSGSVDGMFHFVAGGTLVGVAFLVVYLWRAAALGFGDVRLATVLGALVAWGADGIEFAVGAAFAASVLAVVVMLTTRRRSLPFAPCLIPFAVAAILLGQ